MKFISNLLTFFSADNSLYKWAEVYIQLKDLVTHGNMYF